jgi:sulfite exporter TauE/SafE
MTFLSALLLGLLASAHCAGMCGGLQSALQQSYVIRSRQQAIIHLAALNLGRLSIYIMFGFVFGSLGTTLLGLFDVPLLTRGARYLAALFLIALGLQLIFSNSRPFQSIEKIGGKLWNVISRNRANSSSDSVGRSYRLGLIWGFLPCGLVYGVLLTTLFSNNGLQGAFTLLGFGLGTMPALVLTGTLYQTLRSLVRTRYVQLFGGVTFIQGGLLMILAPMFTSLNFMQTYPQLMSTMFCVS